MATLIRHAKPAQDSWLRLEPAAEGAPPAIPERGDLLVPLKLWQSSAGVLLGRPSGRIGVWLAPDEDPALIADSLDALALVAVFFPQFTDGRGYSTARLLRERYGWRGELRAIGDVQRDQLFYLSRVGFDAFELNDGIDLQSALSAFADFSEAYQTSVERPLPLFCRRSTEAA
ncbi:MAG: DUF934 domain-containing protein [Burkholderiales bacterium]|nr:DUF934 domain-containing protein [Burkholderiales bacterium]